jgi:hypothetical protein
MGAPRKHPPKDAAATIEQLAAQGHAIIGIAKKLGVTKETFKRWCEDDDALQEAFEIGRETERHALHSLIVQSAVLNKPANSNAMFLLKARHGYRENDQQNVNVGVTVVPSVMVVRDHGSDEEWAARAAEQQRTLTLNAASPPKQIEATAVAPPAYVPPVSSSPAWVGNQPCTAATQAAPAYPTYVEAPTWKSNA